MPDRDLGELLEQRPEPKLLERQVTIGSEQVGEFGLERGLVEAGRRPLGGQAEHGFGQERRVFLPEGQQQQQQ